MPSPFNNPQGGSQSEARLAIDESIEVHGEFWCDRCFEASQSATYHNKRVFWECEHCGNNNAVSGVEL